MKLDMGYTTTGGRFGVEGQEPLELPCGMKHWYKETTSDYDPNFTLIEDNTVVHGNLQSVDYFKHRKDEVRKWLKVEPIEVSDDVCILNIRGGEYRWVPSFILPKSYWDRGIAFMKEQNPNMRFEIHTDDYSYAKEMFPEYNVVSDIGVNWRTLNNAKYLLLSNSSFAILPVFLSLKAKVVIAPKYFGRHNVSQGEWLLEQNIVDGFTYMDREGKLFDSETCKAELE